MTTTFFLLAASVCVLAREQYVSQIPNGNNVAGYTAIGHSNSRDGATNAFGRDYGSAGSWTLELCMKDSDGDGQTNGQELGDPCCIWIKGSVPNQTNGISHPGLASMKRTPSLFNTINCTGITRSTASSYSYSIGFVFAVALMTQFF